MLRLQLKDLYSRFHVFCKLFKVHLHVSSLVPGDVSDTFKFTLTGRMGSEPSLAVKQSITIDTMTNFDSDRHGHRDGTCKWAFTVTFTCLVVFIQSQTLQCTMRAYLAPVTDFVVYTVMTVHYVICCYVVSQS